MLTRTEHYTILLYSIFPLTNETNCTPGNRIYLCYEHDQFIETLVFLVGIQAKYFQDTQEMLVLLQKFIAIRGWITFDQIL